MASEVATGHLSLMSKPPEHRERERFNLFFCDLAESKKEREKIVQVPCVQTFIRLRGCRMSDVGRGRMAAL